MTAPTARRPGLVTVLVVLTVIGGIVSIIGGIIAMIAFGGFLIAGVFLIVLGLIYLAVAKGLADGNSLSRMIVAIVSVIQIAFAIYAFVASNDNGTRNSALGSAIVGLIILLILFSPRANEFFGSRSS
jgi:heme/copper-type cytochrome/quinol oxidase subunit 4